MNYGVGDVSSNILRDEGVKNCEPSSVATLPRAVKSVTDLVPNERVVNDKKILTPSNWIWSAHRFLNLQHNKNRILGTTVHKLKRRSTNPCFVRSVRP